MVEQGWEEKLTQGIKESNKRDVVEMAEIKLNNYRVGQAFSNRGEGRKNGNCHGTRSFPFLARSFHENA